MRFTRRRIVDIAVSAAILGALGTLFCLFWLGQKPDPPNYTQIEPYLYMGGAVKSPPGRTDAVLNLCELDDPYRTEVYLWEPIPDAAPAPDLEWLRRIVHFLEEQQQAGRTTYVHCRNGVSRSALVIVAYEMFKNHWTRNLALEFVRKKRPEVRPNPAFMERLLEWQREIRD